MLKFKNMRQRVEFAYDELNTDIYYEGDYLYTLEDHNSKQVFEYLEENQMDMILNIIWNNNCAKQLATN